jgi:GNAT superfamily N-acetyltransferase
MSLIKVIENNIFAIGRYWGNLNSYVSGDEGIYSMNTGIAVADLNWVWNEKPLEKNDVRIINQIINDYRELKLPFWWWVYPCGKSKTTKKILQKEGFNYLEAIPCMAADLRKMQMALQMNDDIDVSFVKNTKELKIWEDISFAGFEMPQKTKKQYNKFVTSFDLSEKTTQKLFIACLRGEPVATALLFFCGDTAGIYFVTTLRAYRDRGIASAMVSEAMKYAKATGYKYSILQSSKEGLNVYLQAGFTEYCRADVYSLSD